jgi:YD repeat-containing protein
MNHTSIKVVAFLLSAATLGPPSSAATTAYQYDALGRLTAVSQGTAQTNYSYDAAGNRSAKQVSSIVPTSIASATGTTIVEKQGNVMLDFNVGNSTATGTLSFYLGATLIGTANVVNGVAGIEISGLSAGAETITAAYSGGGSLTANSVTVAINVVNLNWLPGVLQQLLQ